MDLDKARGKGQDPRALIKFVATLTGIGTLLVALFGLLGYVPGLGVLGSVRADYIPMAPSTAISFLILGTVVLWLMHRQVGRPTRRLLILPVLLIWLFGFLEVIGYWLGTDLNFEETLVPGLGSLGEIPIGLMSWATGVSFTLASIALLLILSHDLVRGRDRRRRLGDLGGWLGTMAMTLGAVFILSYIYGTPLLYESGSTIPMAFTTALGFLFLGTAITYAAGFDHQPLRLFTGQSTRAYLLRFVIPLTITAVFLGSITHSYIRTITHVNLALIVSISTISMAVLAGYVSFKIADRMGTSIDRLQAQVRKISKIPQESKSPTLRINKDLTLDYANPASDQLLTAWEIGLGGVIPAAFASIVRTVQMTGVERVEEVPVGDATILLRFTPVPGEGYVNLYGTDITDLKRAEARVRRFNEELEERVRERTDDLETFAYSVSHDLRTPLRAIEGFSQILVEEHSDALDEKGIKHILRIRNASQRMAGLIDDMLLWARLGDSTLVTEKVDLGAIADEIFADLVAAEPTRTVDLVISPGMEVHGDRVLLRSVLENLIGNAWKFTGERDAARIEITGATDAAGTVIFVRDNGEGFDMAYVEKLFIPFQRLHDPKDYPGSGIGLATVARIISRHGGKVWAEGEVGKGASFYFSLPLNEA